MTRSDVTAVLLCGGKGERLLPLTDSIPKPLIPLLGQPLLGHLLKYLKSQSIEKTVICTGYKAEAIEEFLVNHQRDEWNVVTVNSGNATMTQRLLAARKHFPGEHSCATVIHWPT